MFKSGYILILIFYFMSNFIFLDNLILWINYLTFLLVRCAIGMSQCNRLLSILTNNGKCNNTTFSSYTSSSCGMEASEHLCSWAHWRGWDLDGKGKLRQKMLTCGIVPDNLLKGICCNFKEGERQCQTMKCSWMRAGMSCVSACGVCCEHCSNGTSREKVSSDEEENDCEDIILMTFDLIIWDQNVSLCPILFSWIIWHF